MLESFLPARLRKTSSQHGQPSYLNRQITPLLQSLSRRSCSHPIHAIVFVLLLASTSYIGLLEGSLFESETPTFPGAREADLHSLIEGRRQLRLGVETGWKWWQSNARGVDTTDPVRCLPS